MSRADARRLRASLTPAEKAMWRIVQSGELAALHWRRQAPFGAYVLDLVSHPARLVLEVDGAHHAEAAQAQHDEKRSVYLRAQGYRVERIPNNAALMHGDGVWVSVRAWAWETPARARMERWLQTRASPRWGRLPRVARLVGVKAKRVADERARRASGVSLAMLRAHPSRPLRGRPPHRGEG